VTATCTMRRRSCARSTSTNNSRWLRWGPRRSPPPSVGPSDWSGTRATSAMVAVESGPGSSPRTPDSSRFHASAIRRGSVGRPTWGSRRPSCESAPGSRERPAGGRCGDGSSPSNTIERLGDATRSRSPADRGSGRAAIRSTRARARPRRRDPCARAALGHAGSLENVSLLSQGERFELKLRAI
jgi:hypothetical protein